MSTRSTRVFIKGGLCLYILAIWVCEYFFAIADTYTCIGINRGGAIMNSNRDNVKVTLSNSNGLLAVSTYSRVCGRHGRFLFVKNLLDDGEVCEQDCGNFVRVLTFRGRVTFNFAWLDGLGDRVTGFRQTFELPADLIRRAMNGEKVTYLYRPDCAFPKIVAQRASAKIIRDPLKRRALSKALRDNFHYRNAGRVILSSDGPNDFFFRIDGERLSGGLILSQRSRQINGRERTGYYYSVHT